jgi:hypothetical protein
MFSIVLPPGGKPRAFRAGDLSLTPFLQFNGRLLRRTTAVRTRQSRHRGGPATPLLCDAYDEARPPVSISYARGRIFQR